MPIIRTCDKCGKTFEKKYNYEYHINRKSPCANVSKLEESRNTITNINNKIDQLEEKNKILEKKVEELTKLIEQLMLEKK